MVKIINDFLTKSFVVALNQWAPQIYAGQTSHWKYGRNCWLSYPHSQEVRVTKVQLPHVPPRLKFCLLSQRFLLMLNPAVWKRRALEPGYSASTNSAQKPPKNQLAWRAELASALLAFYCLSSHFHLLAPTRSYRSKPWSEHVSVSGYQEKGPEKPSRRGRRMNMDREAQEMCEFRQSPVWGHGSIRA